MLCSFFEVEEHAVSEDAEEGWTAKRGENRFQSGRAESQFVADYGEHGDEDCSRKEVSTFSRRRLMYSRGRTEQNTLFDL